MLTLIICLSQLYLEIEFSVPQSCLVPFSVTLLDDHGFNTLENRSFFPSTYNQCLSQQGWCKETVNKELEYAGTYIKKAPNNESSWNYARGIIKKNKMKYSDFPSFKVRFFVFSFQLLHFVHFCCNKLHRMHYITVFCTKCSYIMCVV